MPQELRAVVAAYDQLPRLQRALLMLSYLEGVTYAEIAGIVDRSPARVRTQLDRGLAATGGDPYSVRAALDIASWHQPDPVEVSRAFARHSRERASRRRRIGLVGVAAGTIAAALVTVSAVHRPYIEPRPAGVWTFSHTVRTLPGWSLRSRTVEPEWETTILRAERPGDGRCSVAVGASGATWVRQLPPHPSKVRVGTRSAFYAERVWPNGGGAMLWWEYSDAALVIIECGDLATPREVMPKIGNRVALTAEPILLPYRIRSLPRHYEVSSVVRGLVSNSTVVYLARNDYPEGILHISIRYPAGLPMSGNFSSFVPRYTNGKYAAVCRPFGDSHVCIRGELTTPGRIDIGAQRGALAVIDRIASSLEFAPSATDTATWYDARQALPS